MRQLLTSKRHQFSWTPASAPLASWESILLADGTGWLTPLNVWTLCIFSPTSDLGTTCLHVTDSFHFGNRSHVCYMQWSSLIIRSDILLFSYNSTSPDVPTTFFPCKLLRFQTLWIYPQKKSGSHEVLLYPNLPAKGLPCVQMCIILVMTCIKENKR